MELRRQQFFRWIFRRRRIIWRRRCFRRMVKQTMKEPRSLSELEDFAMECIHSREHPGDIHTFKLFRCNDCRSEALKLTIEHHSGSEEWDFKGIIWGECADCSYLNRLFTFTGDSRKADTGRASGLRVREQEFQGWTLRAYRR